MRITKRIEEYIRKQVEAKAELSPEFQRLKEQSDQAAKRYYDRMQQIRDAAQESFIAFLNELNIEYGGSSEFSMHGYFNPYTYLPECKAYREAREELRRQIETTVEEIIVSMEMGGDKNTLNELLEAVHFE